MCNASNGTTLRETKHECDEIVGRWDFGLLFMPSHMEEKNVTRITQSVAATFAVAIALVTLCSPAAAREQFQTTPTTFSGQATAVKGTVLGVPITLVDTGPIDACG